MQLILDCNAWVQWRIPYFNSASYDIAATLTSVVSAITAIYFIGSAIRAQHYLSNDTSNMTDAQEGSTMRTRSISRTVANKAAMRRLLRRVFASGCLMLIITLVFAVGIDFLFHPTCFTIIFGVMYPIVMANSILQIDSFAPVTGAASGPLRETYLAIQSAINSVAAMYFGAEEDRNPGIKRLRFLVGEGPSPRVRKDGPLASRWASITSVVSVHPQREDDDADVQLPWSSLPVCQRQGVSHPFLLAILEAWRIPDNMTTYDMVDSYIIPACQKDSCGFLDVILKTKCPDGWFGPMNVFVSHWWGYHTSDLVAMIGKNEADRKAAGDPPGYYFVDFLALNQIAVQNISANMHQVFVGQLVKDLRDTLLACNSMVMCCAAGPSELPGWVKAATLDRIWCLFECYIALEMRIGIQLQFCDHDELAFRAALSKGGLARVDEVLQGIDAMQASATRRTDLEMILIEIEGSMGLHAFNQLIREGILEQYRSLARKGLR